MELMNQVVPWNRDVATAVLLASGAFAQSAYPSKPVKIIVPYSAGGPADIYARFLGDRTGKGIFPGSPS